MNCQLAYFLLFAAFCGFVAAQTDVPHATVNLTSNRNQGELSREFQLTCDYDLHFPSSPEEQSQKSNWEITVAFLMETMTANPEDRHRVIADYRRTYTLKRAS